MMLTIDRGSQLVINGRNVTLPFVIPMGSGMPDLNCLQSLRLLPGKRFTCLAKWGDRNVVAKLFYAPFRWRTHAMRDYFGVDAMLTANIATPKLLYAGKGDTKGLFILLFEYLTPASNFSDLWYATHEQSQKQQLLTDLTTMLAQFHQAGLCQEDLHLDNFLLCNDKIYALDGANVHIYRQGKNLRRKKSLTNLALFFAHLTTDNDSLSQHAFVDYVKKRGWQMNQYLQISINKLVVWQRRAHRRFCLKKIYRECSAFICNKTPWVVKIWDRTCDSKVMRELLAMPEKFFPDKKQEYLKDGNSSTVVSTKLDNKAFVLKRYNIKNLKHWLKRCWRPTRAQISWRNAHRLQLLGVATPKPIAMMEKRWWIFRGKAYFLCEHVNGQSLDEYMIKQQGNDAAKAMVNKLSDMLLCLYRADISHGDLKATNILVVDDAPVLIDLDGMREHTRQSTLINAWRRDIQRFLLNWQHLPAVYNMFIYELRNKGFEA